MPDGTADWKPIPLKAAPAGGDLATEAVPVSSPYYITDGKSPEWNVDFCRCCCCCGPGACSQPEWCCACCCPLCTFGRSLGDGGYCHGYCGCGGWEACGRGAWSFCCIFTGVNMLAGGLAAAAYVPLSAGCTPSAAMLVGYLVELIACLPGGCYASWLRNQFREENGLRHNGEASLSGWPWACWQGRTSCFDTLCMGAGLCWPCIAYQNVMQRPVGGAS